MPARVTALSVRRKSSRSRGTSAKRIFLPYIFLVSFGLPALSVLNGLGVLGGDRSSQLPVSATVATAVAKSNWQNQVDVVFNPGYQLSKEQMQGYRLADEIPNHPEKYGLDNLGLAPLNFTPAQMEIWLALVHTESRFLHLDPDTGAVLRSEKGCLGETQGCNAVCPEAMWLVQTTNVWCGAKTFQYFWNLYGVDHNVLSIHLAIAGYKGAFLMQDTSGDLVNDPTTGLPIVDPELEWQVRKVEGQLVWLHKP